jgi:hypothetical protein
LAKLSALDCRSPYNMKLKFIEEETRPCLSRGEKIQIDTASRGSTVSSFETLQVKSLDTVLDQSDGVALQWSASLSIFPGFDVSWEVGSLLLLFDMSM